MEDNKDRFGKRLQEKEKGEEDRYFAKREREVIEKLKRVRGLDMNKDALGHCPRCGSALDTIKVHGVPVLQCPVDCGIWLDKGELEVIARREHDSWLGRFFYSPKKQDE